MRPNEEGFVLPRVTMRKRPRLYKILLFLSMLYLKYFSVNQRSCILDDLHARRVSILGVKYENVSLSVNVSDHAHIFYKIRNKMLGQYLDCRKQHILPREHFRKYGTYGARFNLFKSLKNIQCQESVTLAVYGDAKDIEKHLEKLAILWKGPISLAVFVTHNMFENTIALIAYLRKCKHESIRDLVDFHLVYRQNYYPQQSDILDQVINKDITDCDKPVFANTPYPKSDVFSTSVARNIAKDGAKTEFLVNSHISLYPSKQFIYRFFTEVLSDPLYFSGAVPSIFVAPVVEVTGEAEHPVGKKDIKPLFDEDKVFFLRSTCREWKNMLHLEKKVKLDYGKDYDGVMSHYGLEVPYIERRRDPSYDEKEVWNPSADGKLKMVKLCMMGFNIKVLQDGFFMIKSEDRAELYDSNPVCRPMGGTVFSERTIKTFRNLYGRRCNMMWS